jgi:DNA-binding transcriptional MerR regulator
MTITDKSVVLPPIPAKRYFTIGEVSDLCGVKPHVLRYWEQEFTQLKPVKRRGNRRYYQHHEVLLIRKIRELLYEQGFTISGARNRLSEGRETAQDPDAAVRLTALELNALRTELMGIKALLSSAAPTLRKTLI